VVTLLCLLFEKKFIPGREFAHHPQSTDPTRLGVPGFTMRRSVTEIYDKPTNTSKRRFILHLLTITCLHVYHTLSYDWHLAK